MIGILFFIKLFGLELFLEDDHYPMLFLLLLFNGITCIWLTYLVSFFFVAPFNGQIAIFIISYLFSIVLMVLSLAFRLLPKTSDFWINVVENFFLLCPFFSFSMGILNFTMLTIYKNYFGWENPKAFDWRVSGKNLFFLSIFSIFYISLVFLLEYKADLILHLRKLFKKNE